jgi:hypothetical protein
MYLNEAGGAPAGVHCNLLLMRDCDERNAGKKEKSHSMTKKARKIDAEEADLPKLSAPAIRALNSIGVRSLAGLTRVTERQLPDLHGFGPNGLKAIKASLSERGLSLRSTD